MAVVAVNPFFVKAKFSVGTDEYTGHISAFEFVPNAPVAEITDIGGTAHRFAGDAAWSLNLTVIQDYTATGLSRMLLESQGESATVEIETNQGTITASVSLVATSIGGTYGTIGSTQVSLPVTGTPSFGE